MSQEKVDKYKEQKVRRKEIMKKQRRMHLIRSAIISVVAIALLGWMGYSAYDMFVKNQPRQVVEVDYSPVENYLNELTVE